MARRRRNEDSEQAAREHLNGADPEVDGEDESPPSVNSAARAGMIREAHETVSEFERQIDGLKAEIKAVIETRVVAGLGMKKRDFALARKLIALDQDDRDGTFDAIRECFAALGIGEQGSLFPTEAEAGDGAEA